MQREKITADLLRELLTYDPITGVFRWRVKPAKQIAAGSVAGCVGTNGYRRIRIDGRFYLAHRLARPR